MKKLLMTDYNKLELVDNPIPKPNDDQVVIKVKYAGICGSDLHILAGQHPTAKPPFVMGHEVCGEIYSINSSIRKDLKVGDKVTVHAVIGCGYCDMCRIGRENLCESISIMGAGCDGFYSEYVVCPANRVIKFKNDVDMKIAAIVEPLTIAVHDVKRSGLQIGEDVFVAGAGTIGLLIAIVAKHMGASNVVLADISDERIKIAKSFGFETLNSSFDNFKENAILKNKGKKYDKVFEVTGFQGGFDNCLNLVKRSGVMVQVGMPASGKFEEGFNVNSIIFNEVSYMGVRNSTLTSMLIAAKIIDEGELNELLSRVVSAVYSKEKANDAFALAKNNKSMLKVLIEFN